LCCFRGQLTHRSAKFVLVVGLDQRVEQAFDNVVNAVPIARMLEVGHDVGPDAESAPQSVIFYPTQIDEAATSQVQANVRKRLLRAFVARGHLESHDAKDMAGYAHGGGFSVDAGVCASRPPTAQGWSACCATARGPRSLVDRLK
jgi:hypothetical protein